MMNCFNQTFHKTECNSKEPFAPVKGLFCFNIFYRPTALLQILTLILAIVMKNTKYGRFIPPS